MAYPAQSLACRTGQRFLNAALSPRELLARTPVWEALAEFWLDTELTDSDFDHIARVIAASPYSLAEARAIHDYEVAPALSANLMSVAGEWAGFDSEWLHARCRQQAALRRSWWYRAVIRVRFPLFRFFTAHCWRQVVPRVESLRGKPETNA